MTTYMSHKTFIVCIVIVVVISAGLLWYNKVTTLPETGIDLLSTKKSDIPIENSTATSGTTTRELATSTTITATSTATSTPHDAPLQK